MTTDNDLNISLEELNPDSHVLQKDKYISVQIGNVGESASVYVAGGNIILPIPPQIVTNTLPTSINPFIGRNELLNQLRDMLDDSHSGNIICLRGMGGIGKTVLALKLGHESEHIFKGGRHYLSLLNKDPRTSVKNFLKTIGFANENQLSTDYETLCTLMRGSLSRNTERVLLILDNVEEALTQDRTIVEWLCLPSPHTTLIISRVQWLSSDIEIGQLNDKDSLAILTAYGAETSQQSNDAIRLANKLGNLPLALEITATRMSYQNEQTFADTFSELELSESIFDKLKLPGIEASGIAITFARSFDLLNDRQKTVFKSLGLAAVSGVTIEAISWMSGVNRNSIKEKMFYFFMNATAFVEIDQMKGIIGPRN